MELIVDDYSHLITNEFLSISNRYFIKLLLMNDIVSCSQLCSKFKQIFCHLYEFYVERSSFRCFFNRLVSSYLKCIIYKSMGSSALKHYLLRYLKNIEQKLDEIIMNYLHNCFQNDGFCNFFQGRFQWIDCFEDMNSVHLRFIGPVVFHMPFRVHVTKSEDLKIVKDNVNYQVKNSQTFLFPFEKGFMNLRKDISNDITSINIKIKNENACSKLNKNEHMNINAIYGKKLVVEEHEKCKQILKDGFQCSYLLESKLNNDVLCVSYSFCCPQDYTVTQQISSQNRCLKDNNHSEIAVKILTDQTKHQLDCDTKNCGPVAFSRNLVNEEFLKEKCNVKISLNSINKCTDSVSDDSIVLTSDNYLGELYLREDECNSNPMHNNSVNYFSDSDSKDSITFSDCDNFVSSNDSSIVYSDNDGSISSDDECIMSSNDNSILSSDVYDSVASDDDNDNNIFSDNDDFIIFSEICADETDSQEMCITNIAQNSIDYCSDSESDNSIVFSDIYVDVQTNGILNTKEIHNNGINCNEPHFYSDSKNKNRNVIPLSSCGYNNPCFQDDDDNFITMINNNWNITTRNISSEPRKAKKVSFVPTSELASVHFFEPDDDGYCYSLYVLDQVRFQNRIQEFEYVMAPYLRSEHRAKVYRQHYQCDKH